jgi:hypothetical protein
MSHSYCQLSVIITVHRKRKDYITRAVNSVLNSNLKDIQLELIIACDYEDEYIKDLGQKPGVKVVFCDDQLGHKIISGIHNASFDIIVFLEDDDIFLPEKLERVCYAFNNATDLGYYHNFSMSPSSGSDLGSLNTKDCCVDNVMILSSSDFKLLSRGNPDYNMSSIAISRKLAESILKKVNDRYDLLSISPDTFIFLYAISERVKVAIDNQVLTFVQKHDSLSYVAPNKSLDVFLIQSITNLYKFISEYTKFYEFFPSGFAHELIYFKLLKEKITLSILEGKKHGGRFNNLAKYLLYNVFFFPYGDSIKHTLYLSLLSVIPLPISNRIYTRRYFNYIKYKFEK